MRNSTLLYGRDFWGDRLRLDILTIIFTRIFNYNLSVFSVCSVDSYGGCFARNLFKFR